MRLPLIVAALCAPLLVGQGPGWHYSKVDPHTRKPVLMIDAKTFQATNDSNILFLHGMTARIYAGDGSNYQLVMSDEARFNEKLGTLNYGQNLSKVLRLK